MADRTVTVRLIADAQAYISGVEAAERKTREATQSVEQRLAQQRQAFQTVGVAAVAVGTAITGIGIAALRTGIQYNTLQQTSRAALTTLLGSAEAANAQMDKLDDFARNSPFAKQVFIEAQQQLLGFGMAADRVVPTLDAIQNAVAATGGSNQDIAELVRIIAQLEGGVKLSAETFNQFGARGIDAAQLIGDAMGKTGQQIRAEVTAGTLDADQAIQALTDGMQARFAGAADGVKDTFEGAMDRVKAAWRDFSAELARPLVDPNGGGALVDALNWAADMMRAFEALPGPVKTVITTLAFATGAILLLGGTALLAIPRIAEFRVAMETLNLSGSSVRNTIAGLARSLGPAGIFGLSMIAAGALVYGLAAAFGSATASAAQFNNAIETGGRVAPVMQTGIDSIVKGLSDFDSVIGQLDRWDAGFLMWADFGNTSNLNKFVDNLRKLDTAMSALPIAESTRLFGEFVESTDASNSEIVAMIEEMPALESSLYNTASQLGLTLSEMEELERETWLANAALGTFTDVNGEVVAAADLVTDAVDGTVTVMSEQERATLDAAAAIESLTDVLRIMNNDYVTTQDALQAYSDQMRRATEETEALSGVTTTASGDIDVFTESGSAAHDILRDTANQAIDTATAILELDGDVEGANETLTDARGRFIGLLEQMGITGREAERLADKYGLSEDAVLTLSEAIRNLPDGHAEITVDTLLAHQAVDNFIAAQSNRQIILSVNAQGQDRILQPGQRGVYHSGGRLPGYSPGYDDHLAVTAGGYVTGLAGGEWIINPRASSQYDDILRQINAGTFPGYADGGRLAPPSQVSSHTYAPRINVAPASLDGLQVVVVDAFSGEQHLARMRSVAQGAVADGMSAGSRGRLRDELGVR